MATIFPPGTLHEGLLRANVDYFSRNIFGIPYDDVKELLYPSPRYRAFLIAKRDGSPRVILEPRRPLKELQVKVLAFLVERGGPSKPCVHGFVSGRSILSNAKQHLDVSPQHLLNIDLKDFFPSITFYRVRGVLQKAPFELSHEVATVLAQVCTYRNTLPQGAPTSPHLSNLVCRSLDRDLMSLARRHRATYTRYADDITFSFSVRSSKNLPSSVCAFDGGVVTLGNELLNIIQEQHHFQVNDAKTRMSTRLSRLEVTGITINEFLNIRRDFIDRVRGALGAWKKYGYSNAQLSWEQRIVAGSTKPYEERVWRRQTRTGKPPQLKNVIWGKLLYVRMVRGAEDSLYTRLAETYNKLCLQERAASSGFDFSTLPVRKIVRDAADAEEAVFVFEWVGDYTAPGTAKSEMVVCQGTAFAYQDSRQLITCAHVLQWHGGTKESPLEVDFDSPDVAGLSLSVQNPKTGATFSVAVSRIDLPRDLAVLRISARDVCRHRYFHGMDSELHRNEHGYLIGYPNWSPGRTANQGAAVVSSRFTRTGLKRFEVSVSIRQGNSGGPFVDTQFRVAGVAQQGATQDRGNDECLDTSELDAWLASPPSAGAPTPTAPAIPAATAAGVADPI